MSEEVGQDNEASTLFQPSPPPRFSPSIHIELHKSKTAARNKVVIIPVSCISTQFSLAGVSLGRSLRESFQTRRMLALLSSHVKAEG